MPAPSAGYSRVERLTNASSHSPLLSQETIDAIEAATKALIDSSARVEVSANASQNAAPDALAPRPPHSGGGLQGGCLINPRCRREASL